MLADISSKKSESDILGVLSRLAVNFVFAIWSLAARTSYVVKRVLLALGIQTYPASVVFVPEVASGSEINTTYVREEQLLEVPGAKRPSPFALTSPFQLYLKRGVAFGNGAVIDSKGRLIGDFAIEHGRSDHFRGVSGHSAWRVRSATYARLLQATPIEGALVATNISPGNYYHWLLQVLPRICLALQSPMWSVDLPLILTEPALGFKRESLARLGIMAAPNYIALQSAVPLRDAIAPNLPHTYSAYPTWLPALIRESFGVSSSPIVDGRRVLVWRDVSERRGLRNMSEVAQSLRENHFTTIRPGNMSFNAQLELFRECRVVVASHGAALSNMVLMPPGGTVVEFMPRAYRNDCFERLATICGHQYRRIGRPGGGGGLALAAPFDANIQRLREIVDELEEWTS